MRVVDLLLRTALHPVVRVALLSFDILTWWRLVQLLQHPRWHSNQPQFCDDLARHPLWPPPLLPRVCHVVLVRIPFVVECSVQPPELLSGLARFVYRRTFRTPYISDCVYNPCAICVWKVRSDKWPQQLLVPRSIHIKHKTLAINST